MPSSRSSVVAVPDTTVMQAVFQCTRGLRVHEAPKLNIISGHCNFWSISCTA